MNRIALYFRALYFVLKNHSFPGSLEYWEARYRFGGSSGCGSYGALSLFKANVINDFIQKENISSILDFGCGDGHQLSKIKCEHIIGIDYSKSALDIAMRREYTHSTTQIFDRDISNYRSELSISLDVLYHLIRKSEFEEYLHALFNSATKYVIIYSSNFWFPQIYHQKGRKFTTWVEKNQPLWSLIRVIKNPRKFRQARAKETSISDFYLYKKI